MQRILACKLFLVLVHHFFFFSLCRVPVKALWFRDITLSFPQYKKFYPKTRLFQSLSISNSLVSKFQSLVLILSYRITPFSLFANSYSLLSWGYINLFHIIPLTAFYTYRRISFLLYTPKSHYFHINVFKIFSPKMCFLSF